MPKSRAALMPTVWGGRDVGYGEFQAGMQKYFRTGRDWPPGSAIPRRPSTAAYFRERNIGADVIFAVDCDCRVRSGPRETGFRRYNNEEIAEEAAKHSDRRGDPDPLRQHRS